MSVFSKIAGKTVSIVTLTALVFFFILFFGFIYLYDFEMRAKSLDKFFDENQKKAMLISYFFFERKNSVESLAGNKQIENYFRDVANKSPVGVVEKDIESINNFFRNFLDSEKIENKNIYFRIVLLDRNANVVVDTGGLPESPSSSNWPLLLSRKSKSIELISGNHGEIPEIVIKSPCYISDHFAGMLVVFPAWETFLDSLFRTSLQDKSNYLYCMMYRNTLLYKVGAGFKNDLDNDVLSKLPTTQVIPLNINKKGVLAPVSGDDFSQGNYIGIKLPVDYTPFRLISLLPKRSVLASDQYVQLLLILFVLLIVILVGIIFIAYNFTRNKILENKLNDEKLRKEIVETKNAELENQILSKIAIEKELKKAKEQAETANDAKSIFLANMSHELRTPLNGIIGMTELLNETESEVERKELAGIVLKSSYSLLTIINEILDLSKIEAGRLELENHEFDINEISLASLKSLLLRAQEAGVQFSWYIDPAVPRCLVGDYNKLMQVIINLVSNAIKFTPVGSVVLKVKLKKLEESNNKAWIDFSVKDTGIGIAEEKQKIIFDAFVQADSSVSRKYGGTGLGLCISSKIITILGGRINLKSDPGIGSEFYFSLPFTYKVQKSEVMIGKTGSISLLGLKPGLRILLVEDNNINRMLIMKLFEKTDLIVEQAENGAEAVQACRDKQYDMIFMDLQMPVMGGLAATGEIRKLEQETGRHVPIVAMTANAMKEDREACMSAGMDDFITKPVKKNILYEKVTQYLAK
jgi:signal transduction histidine kinase/CheY-like chemotaxis protein